MGSLIRGDNLVEFCFNVSVLFYEAVAGSREGAAWLCCWASASVNRVVDHPVVGCGHDDG